MSQLNPDHILQTGFAFWASKTLLSAIEMGLFTELAQGPLASEALRTRLKLHPRSARDFFETIADIRRVRLVNGRAVMRPSALTQRRGDTEVELPAGELRHLALRCGLRPREMDEPQTGSGSADSHARDELPPGQPVRRAARPGVTGLSSRTLIPHDELCHGTVGGCPLRCPPVADAGRCR